LHNGTLNGVDDIFGTLLSRARRQVSDLLKAIPVPARRTFQRKRTLLLLPLLVAVFFVAVAEHGHPATGKAGTAGLAGAPANFAALGDPLSYIADRSPGERGAGTLLSTKPNFGPQERVLSTERDRNPPAGVPSEMTNPVFGTLPAGPGTENALPGAIAVPGDGGAGDSGDTGFFPGGGFPSVPNATQFLPFAAGPTILTDVPGVPEPATWAMLILGFFAVGMSLRRRGRKQPQPICIS
jgi:hypothetical protein